MRHYVQNICSLYIAQAGLGLKALLSLLLPSAESAAPTTSASSVRLY